MKKIKNTKKLSITLLVSFLITILSSCGGKPLEYYNVDDKAKNVILLIGDGMGQAQVKAGELYKGEPLFMQGLPYKTLVETRSNSSEITDSAAAATALATGIRTTNSVVGKDSSLQNLTTIVDIAKEFGKKTGVLTTETLKGATPMGFSGHSNNRGNYDELLKSAAESSNVDLFACYSMPLSDTMVFSKNDYKLINNVDDISESKEEKIIGTYRISASAESMSDSTSKVAFDRVVTEALDYLSQDKDGFFLMAEGSHIDHGGHANDIMYMLSELIAFDDVVKASVEWAKEHKDTVVIVTADHETGGLTLSPNITSENMFDMSTNDDGQTYTYDNFYWTTENHTSTDVYCYVFGADIPFENYSFNSELRIKNTDIFQIMYKLIVGK